MFSKYDIAYLISLPFITPPLLYKMLFKKKYRSSFRGMIGKNIGENDRESFKDVKTCWVHAVSVGEVVAARAIVAEFKKEFPEYKILVSTITETGQKKANEILSDADRIIYFPVDFSPIANKFLSVFKPDICILMESEFWPNFLRLAKTKESKIFLCNGKMSTKSFRYYKALSFIFKKIFDNIDGFLMQTDEDAQRISNITKHPSKVFVTGNCKFDSAPQQLNEEERNNMLNEFRLSPDSRIIVVGSTHQDEEKIILNAFEEVRKVFPDIKMIISPRHPERFNFVRQLLQQTKWKVSSATQPTITSPDILFLDQMGRLSKVYGLGKVSIVGGSFVPIGGHNLLEPLAHKVPVIYGPHMERQKEITQIVEKAKGGIRTNSANLADVVTDLLNNEEKRKKIGEDGFKALSESCGSAHRTIELIKNLTS